MTDKEKAVQEWRKQVAEFHTQKAEALYEQAITLAKMAVENPLFFIVQIISGRYRIPFEVIQAVPPPMPPEPFVVGGIVSGDGHKFKDSLERECALRLSPALNINTGQWELLENKKKENRDGA